MTERMTQEAFDAAFPQQCHAAARAPIAPSIIARESALRATRANAEETAKLEIEDSQVNQRDMFFPPNPRPPPSRPPLRPRPQLRLPPPRRTPQQAGSPEPHWRRTPAARAELPESPRFGGERRMGSAELEPTNGAMVPMSRSKLQHPRPIFAHRAPFAVRLGADLAAQRSRRLTSRQPPISPASPSIAASAAAASARTRAERSPLSRSITARRQLAPDAALVAPVAAPTPVPTTA